jgi:hypothetical protein
MDEKEEGGRRNQDWGDFIALGNSNSNTRARDGYSNTIGISIALPLE